MDFARQCLYLGHVVLVVVAMPASLKLIQGCSISKMNSAHRRIFCLRPLAGNINKK